MEKENKKLLRYRNISKVHLVRIFGVMLIVMTIFTMGCTPEVSSQTVASIKKMKKPQPIKIALCIDQSKSTSQTRVQPISTKAIASLIDILKMHGGELAFCTIRSDSNVALARHRIPSPPIVPIAPIPTGNEFDDASNKARHKASYTKYLETKRRWEADIDKKIARYLKEVEPIVKQARNATSTDLAGALTRINQYLSEPQVNWKGLKKYVILVTDGLASSDVSANQVKSGIEMIWVNAAGETSDLDVFQPSRFENFSEAVRYISESNES